MNKITTIGLDIAKNTFHVMACDNRGKMVQKKKLIRLKVLSYFANLPASLVGIEACSSAHYWGRELIKLGHEVKLIPPQHVKAFVQGNKNDFNDALAIAEAVVRPHMRFVAVKTVEQQDLQILNVRRQQMIHDRTTQVNRIRAMLMEQGVVIPKGIWAFRRQFPDLLNKVPTTLSTLFMDILRQTYEQLLHLERQITHIDQRLKQVNRQVPACQQLQTIPGFGPILSSFFYSYIGRGHEYHCGRDVASALGLVPRQHSSGGKDVLLGISKRGNKQLRCLLVHGARSVVSRAGDKTDALSQWIQRLIIRVGIHKAVVAYANKMARIGWAVLRHDTVYQVHQAAAEPA